MKASFFLSFLSWLKAISFVPNFLPPPLSLTSTLCRPCLTSQYSSPPFFFGENSPPPPPPPCFAMKVSVKSKKERLKRLSLVGTGRKNWRSGVMRRTVVCYNKDDGPTDGTKRLKLSKKLLSGCNVAGKTTVPRKLRTAMKKRNCESPSSTLTDLKKPSHREDRLPEQNVVKKLKRDVVLNSCPGKSFSGPMTKDEQEVAEVLFAMASMFSDSGASQDAHCRHIYAQTDKLVLLDAMECSITAEEGMKPESDFHVHSMKKEAVPTSLNEGNHGEETKVVVTSDEPVINRINLQDKQPFEEPARKEEPSIGTWFRSEISTSKMPISCNAGFNSESCIDSGLERSEESMQAVNGGTSKLNDGLASCSGRQLPYTSFLKGFAKKDPPAWSIGLPMVSNGSSNPLETSTSKMPNWIDATVQPQRPTSKGASHPKASKNTVARIPWKRCAIHVQIGYHIQELKGRDTKDSVSMQYLHMKPEMDANIGLRRFRTCSSNGVTLANTIAVKREPIFNEFKGGIPSLETTPKEKQLQNLRSVVYKPEKQVYDFLSLSSGGSGVDPHTRGSRISTRGAKLDMSGMSSYLCLGTISTRGAHQPIPTSNNHFPHVNQASAAGLQQVRLQLPTHLGSSGSTLSQKGPCILTKEQLQQQQQMLWAAMAHRQGLQVNLDHATGMQCSLPMVPSFPVTYFPKYAAKVPQHLASLSQESMSSYSSKRSQDHCPPAGVQFYAGALSPQLLCNKRL